MPRRPLAKRCALAALLFAGLTLGAPAARAQLVAVVNGAPITEIDISQRIKFQQLSTNKTPTRKQVLNELIDEHLKIFVGKRYGLDITEAEVDQSVASMAERAHVTPQQMEQQFTSRGISIATLRQKIRADLGWGQLVRGRYSASLQISETDIRNALQSRKDESEETEGYIYTVYPITFVASRGVESELVAAKRVADSLRSRFASCDEGLKIARAMRGVIVRVPITRNSVDLAPSLRAVVNKMEVGTLTAPEVTPQGIQVFALCDRKANSADSPARRAAREELFAKRFEAESKKLLEQLRRQAMIEYR